MPGRECYHCKQWIEEGEAHDCWTTTEAALTRDLGEDLQDAYERLRETAAEFGEQRIYASHHSIMFSRKSCYFFVRPKRKYLEVVVFLGRRVHGPQVKKADSSSKTKIYHTLHIVHRDQVEAPVTDWLREAYGLEDALAAQKAQKAVKVRKVAKKASAPKKARKAVTKQAVAAKKKTAKKTAKKTKRATRR